MIPYLDKKIVKIGLVITLVGLLIGIFKWYHGFVFDAGADSVRAELAAGYAIKEEALNTQLKALLAINEIAKGKASIVQDNLRKSQAEARRLRDEINDATFDCKSIGGDFMELWNKTITQPI